MHMSNTDDFPARLLKRDLLRYVKSLGFSDEDAEVKATALVAFVQREAQKFSPGQCCGVVEGHHMPHCPLT